MGDKLLVKLRSEVIKHLGVDGHFGVWLSQFTLIKLVPVAYNCKFDASNLGKNREELAKADHGKVDNWERPVLLLDACFLNLVKPLLLLEFDDVEGEH